MDRGANGGILGGDARVIHKHSHQVDVTGIDNHQLQALDIVDGIAKTTSNKGDVLILLRNYAYFGRQRTIHSSGPFIGVDKLSTSTITSTTGQSRSEVPNV